MISLYFIPNPATGKEIDHANQYRACMALSKSAPQEAFDTALITFSKWKRVADDRLIIGQGNGAVEVAISTDGQPWRLQPEEIHEDLSGGRVPVRLGIILAEAVDQARVTVKITPVDPDSTEASAKLSFGHDAGDRTNRPGPAGF